MDCPSEENLIRMKLEGHSNIEHLEFDIPNRQLTVFHHDNIEGIETAIHDLKLGDTLLSTETIDPSDPNNNFKVDAERYNQYIISDNDRWHIKLKELKKYIDEKIDEKFKKLNL